MDDSSICQITDIPTIKQATYYYCAAACIKMCLDINYTQEEIYNELEKNTLNQEQWYAEPDSVYNFLSKHNKYARTSDVCDSSIDATEWIVSCMISNNNSAPMLVSGGRHWVLYSGYQMNNFGSPSGIFIRDPWPTTASLTFFPFTKFFFDEYFTKINVEGKWKNKVESFFQDGIEKFVNLDVIEKPSFGGVIYTMDINHFKNQIIKDDMSSYGFNNLSFIKSGGNNFKDLTIYDIYNNPKFLLTPVEVDRDLTMIAIDIKSLSVIGLLKMNNNHYSLFDNHNIINLLLNNHSLTVNKDDITFVYDADISSSCFDPIINIKNVGNFDLSLEQRLS